MMTNGVMPAACMKQFYPNLPSGEYIFHVKAANDKGVWNEQGATLKIIIKLPWWRTSLAYIIYVIIIICITILTIRYFQKSAIKKEKEKSQARELEHAKEIEKAYYKLAETHEDVKGNTSPTYSIRKNGFAW